ncbi:MAG: hypothetical protein KDD50_01430 [Bdellovibrionales bacterium]|nr:hypothetical protein [Bdellovibrionales bacterium]
MKNSSKITILFVSLVSFFLIPLKVNAGYWHRISETEVVFRGDIENGELSKFLEVFDNKVKFLTVTSGGGNTYEALEIANILKTNNVTVIVKIWCLSSCANYLFLAGKDRIIENGIVGFHGGINSCFASEEKRKESELRLRNFAETQGLTDQQIENSIVQNRKFLDRYSKMEKDFLKYVEASEELFIRACTSDKGMGDGKPYAFLLPTNETFASYGVFGVIGHQDPATIEWFSGDLIVD